MSEVIIKFKDSKVLETIHELSRHFDIEIKEYHTKIDDRKDWSSKKFAISFAKYPNANAFSGIWKNSPHTLKSIRKQAWGDRL